MKISEVYGFNYDGSWGSSGLDVWQHHDHGRMAVEIARGKTYFPEWNTARWWLSHHPYQQSPAQFLANFEAGLSLFAQHDIQVIPVLFNRWLDPVCDFGGVPIDHIVPHLSVWNKADDLFLDTSGSGGHRTLSPVEQVFRNYLLDVVGAHADDPRILMWDLCNEPLMGAYVDDADSAIRQAELRWLTWCRSTCQVAGASQPITVGNYQNLTAVSLTEPISDVISFHPYYIWNGDPVDEPMSQRETFERLIDEVQALAAAAGKELLASETVWGARDDAVHVEVMRYTLDQLVQRGIGFTVHALHHSLVSDLHRDEYGPVGPPECLHFIEADGQLRTGHEAFNEFAPSARGVRS
ncbi:MAG: hypothetical protein ABWX96_07810 [Propionibacteriaceae bacterium]